MNELNNPIVVDFSLEGEWLLFPRFDKSLLGVGIY